jgi:hypothetical protein
MTTTTSRDGRAATPRSKEGGGGGGAASVGGKRVARGEAARAQVPRATHAAFEPSPTRADPVELLEFSKACAEQNERDFRRLDAAVDSGELVARTVGRRNPDRRHRHEHTPDPCRPRRDLQRAQRAIAEFPDPGRLPAIAATVADARGATSR